MIKQLKKELRRYLTSFDHSTQFFSQGGEDAILHGIFLKMLESGRRGFFVDVGAYHPFLHSNTYRLYLNGWRGINIDANPNSMRLFCKHRPEDINLEIGIGRIQRPATFFILDESSTMNSFSKENLEVHGMVEAISREVSIEIRTLASVLDEHHDASTEIDLLTIDAEGWDHQVLCSNNWDKYKPGVIIVELPCQNIEDVKENKSARLLFDLNYTIVAKNVLKRNLASVFFIHKNYHY